MSRTFVNFLFRRHHFLCHFWFEILTLYLSSKAEVVDPPLNIYCYLEEKMYVRVPMTLRITLKNPTRKILHLQALLNSSDSFMFSGHRQVRCGLQKLPKTIYKREAFLPAQRDHLRLLVVRPAVQPVPSQGRLATAAGTAPRVREPPSAVRYGGSDC